MEIKLSAPLVEVVCPEEAAAADERVAVVDVIEYCGSHAAVAWGCGEVVGMGTEDAFETAVFAARVEREEITFALEAGDVGIFGEQVLVCGVEQPGCATDRFEGTVGEVFGKKFSDLAEGIAAIFKFHWSVFGDVNFEDGVTFDEGAIPAGTREANWLALRMAVGVNGIAGDMGRGFGVFGCPGTRVFPSARAIEVAVGAKFQARFAQETQMCRGAMAIRAHFLAKRADFVLQASYAVEVAVEMAEQPG